VLDQRDAGHPGLRWYYQTSFVKQYVRGDQHRPGGVGRTDRGRAASHLRGSRPPVRSVNKISITLGAKTVRLARLVICNPSKIRSRCDPASSKLDDAPWGDFPAATVTRDPAATIRELKEQSGKDIWLWGSLELMHSLLDAGVVDEVQMRVCPASRGKGTRIFEDRQNLKLLEATGFDNDVVLLRYEIKK
jgi:hypothetical protein